MYSMKNSRFKILTIFLLMTVFLTAGFGCKGLSKEQQSAVKAVSLEYWTVADDVDELKNIIATYQASRSYITVTVRQYTESEIYTRFIEALAEDKGPDIISVHNRMLPAYKSKLATMPASVNDTTMQIVKKQLGSETLVNMSTIAMPSVVQLENEYVQTVKKDVVMDNKIYGLPLSLDTMALYYNKDLLDRAGVATPPATWNDFQAAVKKITKLDKDEKIVQSGGAIGTSNNVEGFDDLLYIIFEQSGIKFSDSNNYAVFSPTAINSANDPVVKIMDFYTDFADSTRDTYTWDKSMANSLTAFTTGKTAFFFGYSYHYKKIKTQAPQLNLAVVPMLQLNSDKPVNVANYWVQSVSKKSTNQNEAWGLINYLTHSKATKTYLDSTKRPTAMRAYITEQKTDTILKPFVDQILVANNWYRGKSYSTAKKALEDMVTQWHKVTSKTENINNVYIQILGRATSRINQTL